MGKIIEASRPSMPPSPSVPQFYTICTSYHNPPNLSWPWKGTKYAGLHTWRLGLVKPVCSGEIVASRQTVSYFCNRPSLMVSSEVACATTVISTCICTYVVSSCQSHLVKGEMFIFYWNVLLFLFGYKLMTISQTNII